ncbi:Pectin lyase-like superfamily protein [Zea mays]|nr:Pectin lyase-like superfamily protein [Zea mays]
MHILCTRFVPVR